MVLKRAEATKEKRTKETLFFKFFSRKKEIVFTQHEIDYFSKHPDQIDEYFSSLHIHKAFLIGGILVGTIIVIISKLLEKDFFEKIFGKFITEVIVDISYESGVALIGASITAYLLGVLLNQQQDNAQMWRQKIREEVAKNQSKEN